ncbi:Hypothetical predicted protein [Cloeon dipterum]|uniref:Ion transport domain-containing protein n=1 Tax=Cloeon dipterum TaxID=197152 RepID=A0A8S1E2Y4_9INSE|nr:Hypothetical predicted protein [Cloeon dipterum]
MFSDELLNNLWIATYILFVPIAVIVVIVELIFCGVINDGSTGEYVVNRRNKREQKSFLRTIRNERRLLHGKDSDAESALSQEEKDDTEDEEDLNRKKDIHISMPCFCFSKTKSEKQAPTWLMLAARNRDLRSCLELVEKGGDATATTHHGVTLLHFAALNKRHAVYITSHFVGQGLDDLLKKDVDGESPIYYAVRLGLFEAAEKLLALRSTGIKNLLHYFVAEDKLEIVKRVHSWNKKLFEAVDPEGKNALHFAAL